MDLRNVHFQKYSEIRFEPFDMRFTSQTTAWKLLKWQIHDTHIVQARTLRGFSQHVFRSRTCSGRIFSPACYVQEPQAGAFTMEYIYQKYLAHRTTNLILCAPVVRVVDLLATRLVHYYPVSRSELRASNSTIQHPKHCIIA